MAETHYLVEWKARKFLVNNLTRGTHLLCREVDYQGGFILRSEVFWDRPSTSMLWRAIFAKFNYLNCFQGRSAVVDTEGLGNRSHQESPGGTLSLQSTPFEEKKIKNQVLMQQNRKKKNLGPARRSRKWAANYAVLPGSKLRGNTPLCVYSECSHAWLLPHSRHFFNFPCIR